MLLWLTIVCLLSKLSNAQPQVDSVSPTSLGYGGGITVTVTGSGFSEDQFNYFDETIGNVVKFVNEADTIDCDVINYFTNPNKIVCSVRPRVNSNAPPHYYLIVFADGVKVNASKIVEFRSWISPVIASVSPLYSLVGTMLTINGWFRSSTYQRIDLKDPLSTGGTTGRLITKVYMGSKDCTVYNETTNAPVGQFDDRKLDCIPTSNHSGAMNVSIYVTERGASYHDRASVYVDCKDKLGQHFTYGGILEISQNTGGTNGGTLSTITGVGFNPYPGTTKVEVGGAPCDILSITERAIQFRTPNQDDTGPASGQRGLLWEQWNGVNISVDAEADYNALVTTHAGYSSVILEEAKIDIQVSAITVGKLKACFHPPHDGQFQFGIYLSNAEYRFYAAEDGAPANKTLAHNWKTFDLKKGKILYIEIHYRGSVSTSLTIKMNDYDTTWNYANSRITLNEVTRLNGNPKLLYETQRISFVNAAGQISFSLNNVVSSQVNGSDPDKIREAILSLLGRECEVSPSSVRFTQDAGFEDTTTDHLKNVNGYRDSSFEAFCGRFFYRTHEEWRTIFSEGEERYMPDLNRYPYICLAIKGSIKDEMRIRFRWYDNNGKTRTDDIYFKHKMGLDNPNWNYYCIDAKKVAEDSWINSHRKTGDVLKLNILSGPNPKFQYGVYYFDSVKFADKEVTVTRGRPSALVNPADASKSILIKDVEVTSVTGEANTFDVRFITSNCNGDFPLIGVGTTAPVSSQLVQTLATAQSHTFSGTATVTRTTAASHPVTGTYDMTIEGVKVKDISTDIDNVSFQEKLESALGPATFKVQRRGDCDSFQYYLTWQNIPGRKGIPVIDQSRLVFDGSTDPVMRDSTRQQAARNWHDPVPGCFFTVCWPRDKPHIAVTVDGYSTVCQTDCAFQFHNNGIPSAASVSITFDGTKYTGIVTGSGFTSSNLGDYSVLVGNKDGVVTSVSSTEVGFTVDHLVAGSHLVRVGMQPVGWATQPSPALSKTVVVALTAVTPSTGGTGGGYTVTASGTGLPENLAGWTGNTITSGGSQCTIVSATSSSVTFTVPPGTAGPASIIATVDGTASAAASFTYDASLSASVASISQTTSSVLGGDTLTIAGSDFGSTQGTSSVMIGGTGGRPCAIVSWADTSIDCTLPSMPHGQHSVLVAIANKGWASGSYAVTYTFKVTGSSTTHGSVQGGTRVVIRGAGFGTNCTLLQVDLCDNMKCDVIDCSDTEILCQVRLIPKRHFIRNNGSYSNYGKWHAWNPRTLNIREGDTVSWVWIRSDPTSQLKYSVFQISAPGVRTNDIGFTSGAPSFSGSISRTYPNAQTVYYAGDPLPNNLVMTGQVNVLRPEQKTCKVSVILGGVTATNQLGSGGRRRRNLGTGISGCASTVDVALSSCDVNGTTYVPTSPPDSNHLYFILETCFTPTITNVSADSTQSLSALSGLQVSAGVTLTILGTGFGSLACQNLVKIGDATCTVTAATDTSITCQLQSQPDLCCITSFPIYVNVVNRGVAMIKVSNYDEEGKITVVPVVSSFSPTQGSVNGGTKITITGTALKACDGITRVTIGSKECVIESVTSTTIICKTQQAAAGSYVLKVYSSTNRIEAINTMANAQFTFSDSSTPSVTGITVSGENATITGTLFGTDTSQVSVTLTKSTTRHKRDALDSNTEFVRDPAVKIQEEKIQRGETKFKPILDKEGDAYRYTSIPKVEEDLFGEVKADNSFWGKLTGTDAQSFEDTMKLNVWRKVADWREEDESPIEVKRSKRQAAAQQTSYNCVPTAVSNTGIQCSIPGVFAGTYSFNVNIGGLGYANIAAGAATVTVSPTISSIAPQEGSTNGGALLTISGTGFIPGQLSVDIGGSACTVEEETANRIKCRTSSHAAGAANVAVTSGGVSVTASDQYSFLTARTPVLTSISQTSGLTSGIVLALTGSSFMLGGAAPKVLIGGSECTVAAGSTDTAVSCTSPDLAGGTHSAVVRDSVYGDSNSLSVQYSMTLTSVTPSTGGYGGIGIVLSGTGFSTSSGVTITVCGDSCTNVAASSSTSLKCSVPSRAQGGSSTQSCDVVVTNPGGVSVTLTGGFTYDASITPKVTGISPVRGGTAGGTTLTISGTGFASTGNNVTIGGSECKISSESNTQIICVTEAHRGPGEFPVKVDVPNAGIATTNGNADFFYIDRWSSSYTWGGGPVPTAGQLAVINEGQTILLDQSTPVLKMLLIMGGKLIFDTEATAEIVLRSEYILIVDGGSLSIGSEEEPFTGKAVIELHGTARSIELPDYGAKVLAVRNGSLDLHGAYIPVTWTHLASTAAKGATTITLKQPVTWKKDDKIIIATTERRFMINENEERTIASVSADGRTLTLTEALKYEHISIEQTIAGRTIETRAEVGLLTRNVKVRGAINKDFADTIEGCDKNWKPGQFNTQSCFNGRFGEETGSDDFGATVMISGKLVQYGLAYGRIAYVEVTEAGQAFQLGRYPIHFHLVGNVNQSYVRGCAIHRTYNRAVTVHAADNLTVERNVVYNNMGHAIFTEDGNEQNNVIQYNLAIYTRTSSSLLNVDVTPSSYWVVNPNNIVRHNAAAGGTHFGYWYRLERHPSGPSATTAYCQNNEVMGQFYNNTAHSMGRYGLWVFSMDGYFPKSGVCDGSPLVAVWHDFTVWYCDRGAEVVFGRALQFNNFVALDNEHAGLEMVKVEGGFGVDDGPGIFNSLVVGYSQLTPEGCTDETSGIIGPKQYIFSIANTTFVNYDTGRCAALSGCSQCKPFQGGYRVQVERLVFINSPNKLKFLWVHETIWIDADGSLSGVAENTVVATMGTLPSNACQRDVVGFSVNPDVTGSVCNSSLEFFRVHVPSSNVRPTSFHGRDIILTTSAGNTSSPYRVKRLVNGAGWMFILFNGDTFNWAFDYSGQVTNFSYKAYFDFLNTGDKLYVEHGPMIEPDGFGTLGSERNSTDSASSLNVHGDYFWDNSTKKMTYRVSTNLSKRKRSTVFDARGTGTRRTITFNVYRCYYPGCVTPTAPNGSDSETTYKWSVTDTWKEVPVGTGGHPTDNVWRLPTVGESIIVPPGMKLLVDTTTPSLGRVTVQGTLEFEDTMDHAFECTIIYIQGGRVIAGVNESSPFTHNLTITLRGSTDASDSDNEELVMPYPTPTVGWKAIGVFGLLSLHGDASPFSWVKLGATAAVGDSQLTLASPADSTWLNRQVMVTATGKEAAETEVRRIIAISGSSVTLDSALQYEHLGVTHDFAGTSYTMAAEVGLLERKIVIEGTATTNSFGGRVLVGKTTFSNRVMEGIAKLSNVEFRNMGQEGYSDSYDPRFALAFHSLDDNDGGSYVKHCSFNHNYNTAIGFFSSNGITAQSNVIYHTVGSGIHDESESNVFRYNLLSTILFTGTYDGRNEPQNFNYYGGFYLNDASKTVLDGNVVSGAEQAGFRTYGEYCDDANLWTNNEIHSAMYGVFAWKKSKAVSKVCKRMQGFYAWRIFDTSFFWLTSTNSIVSNVVSIDSRVGVNQIIYGPQALTHELEMKKAVVEHSVFVGASPSHTCAYHSSTPKILSHFSIQVWNGGINGGNIGILLATFTSSRNLAPKASFHGVASYPALQAGAYIENVTFASFNTRSCGKDMALMTNKKSDDATHPIIVSKLTFENTTTDNKVFFDKPNLGAINPSDCVDMSCDGLKKVILQDMDGSLLGSINATLTSLAEHEWDGDRRYGIGDYRIPASMRMNIDGSNISAADKFPNKGIYRDSSCTSMTIWNAWKCTNIRHRMMIIESMDGDTEIRRLSPISLIANPGPQGYVDLLNGPMDRGWCFGYTCQERISTFYAVVGIGQVYEMGMTSTPPQVLRLQLLHSDPSECIVVQVYYPKTQRYDVYVDDSFLPPTNIDNSSYPGKYELMSDSLTNTAYVPEVTDRAGSNYLNKTSKLLHVTICGGSVYQIKTQPTIILNTGIVVNSANFYENDIINNMAALLGIDPANIRITNIVREGSAGRRKKRNAIRYSIEFEVSSPPTETANASVTTTVVSGTALSYDNLTDVLARAVDAFQSGACSGCNITIARLEVIDPVPPPQQPGPRATEAQGSVITNGTLYSDLQQSLAAANLEVSLKAVSYEQPSNSRLEQDVPPEVVAFTAFPSQPVYNVLSSNGSVINSLGHSSNPWVVTATLAAGPAGAILLGTAQVQYLNGAANFTNLAVNKHGTGYRISFNVTSPTSAPALQITGNPFNASTKNVQLRFHSFVPSRVTSVNESVNATVQLVDGDTGSVLDVSVLQGQRMSGNVTLISGGTAQVEGDTSFAFDDGDMATFTLSLSFNELSPTYTLSAQATVEPVGWNLQATGMIQGTGPSTSTKVTLYGDRAAANLTGNEAEFAGLLRDSLNTTIGSSLHWSVSVSVISGNKPYAVINITGETRAVEAAVKTLCTKVHKHQVKVSFYSNTITMVNMYIYEQGIRRRCPVKVNTHIFIKIVQMVNGKHKLCKH